jgi:glycosyltransferase involved in cell wall biosynthesis
MNIEDGTANIRHLVRLGVDLTPMLPGGRNGGVKPAILEFLKGLSRQFRGRFQYLFFTADDTHDEAAAILDGEGTAVCVLRREGKSNLAQSIALATGSKRAVRELIKKHHIDVLYYPFGRLNFGCGRIPAVAMIADLLHRDYPYSLPAQTREWRELQFRKLAVGVDYFQAVSEFTAERLHTIYNIPMERICVTRHPIHGRLMPIEMKREPFFFYPANFWIHKNHEVLLVAFQIYLSMSRLVPPWDLVLTGYQDERGRDLQAIAADLGIAGHVRFLGHVSEQELAKLYATASCLVFPSLYEGYGIPMVEAMSFGVPIICGRDASIPEIAGNAAFYEDMRNPSKLANALLAVSSNPVLQHRLAADGRQRISRIDFSLEITRLADLFNKAAKQTDLSLEGHRNFFNNWNAAGAYYARSIARHLLNAATEIPLQVEQFSRISSQS